MSDSLINILSIQALLSPDSCIPGPDQCISDLLINISSIQALRSPDMRSGPMHFRPPHQYIIHTSSPESGHEVRTNVFHTSTSLLSPIVILQTLQACSSICLLMSAPNRVTCMHRLARMCPDKSRSRIGHMKPPQRSVAD
jgi:hypothetical protein